MVLTYEQAAKVFKALCDENRLHVLELLCKGEKCACVLLEKLQILQPTLSHHMKILCDAGFVNSKKEGRWTHYSINEQGCIEIRKQLGELTTVNGVPLDNNYDKKL